MEVARFIVEEPVDLALDVAASVEDAAHIALWMVWSALAH
jgi:hypothetical protein